MLIISASALGRHAAGTNSWVDYSFTALSQLIPDYGRSHEQTSLTSQIPLCHLMTEVRVIATQDMVDTAIHGHLLTKVRVYATQEMVDHAIHCHLLTKIHCHLLTQEMLHSPSQWLAADYNNIKCQVLQDHSTGKEDIFDTCICNGPVPFITVLAMEVTLKIHLSTVLVVTTRQLLLSATMPQQQHMVIMTEMPTLKLMLIILTHVKTDRTSRTGDKALDSESQDVLNEQHQQSSTPTNRKLSHDIESYTSSVAAVKLYGSQKSSHMQTQRAALAQLLARSFTHSLSTAGFVTKDALHQDVVTNRGHGVYMTNLSLHGNSCI